MFGFIRKAMGKGIGQMYNNANFNEVNVGLYDDLAEGIHSAPKSAMPVIREYQAETMFYNEELDQQFSYKEMLAWASDFLINALPFGSGEPFLWAVEDYSRQYQETGDEYFLGLLNAHILIWDRAMA